MEAPVHGSTTAAPDPAGGEGRGEVSLGRALPPLVLAVDIGSTSTRVCLFDARARPVLHHEAQVRHRFREGVDGSAVIDADEVTTEVADLFTRVLTGLPAGCVHGVAMDTFASSLVCVDAEGAALTPCLTYADSRSAAQVGTLRASLDGVALHQATGVPLHTSYHAPRLLWLAREHPEVMARTARFVSLGEYVLTGLAGVDAAATSTMAWAGILDRHTGDLHADLLEVTGTHRDQFARILDPDEPVRAPSSVVAERWPALVDALWFPAIPDGYASNLGVGATDATTVALSAATSGALRVIVPGTPAHLPPGLWAYRVSAEESIVGGALNDVGRVMTWLEATLAPVPDAERDAVLRGRPRPGTPLVLPFLTGERSTGWAGEARGVVGGMSSSTRPVDLWRGAVEGVAIAYRRIFEQLGCVDPDIRGVVASGGVTQHYPATMEVITQALGCPVTVVDVPRVTVRGTAVMALSVLDPGGDRSAVSRPTRHLPDPTQGDYYADLRARFDDLYRDVSAGR